MKEKSLAVINICKKYGKAMVLNDVSMECRQGEITGIVGRNGAGKTVLFKIICGLSQPDSGAVWVDGEKRTKAGDILMSAGIIIEEPAFLKNYSGFKNLEYLYMIRQKAAPQYLESILQKVGLESASRKHVGKYSMGMKQRLAIAQAIMENPDYLILDEPFNGLDNQGVLEMRTLFLEMKEKGKIILLASHNKEDIEILCDHVYEMDAGRLNQIR